MISLNTQSTVASLNRFAARVRVEGTAAVRKTAKGLISEIVERTQQPGPGGPVYYYTRTNRLVNGWAEAGKLTGVAIPPSDDSEPGDSSAEMIAPLGSGDIVFRATNHVPYAPFVEYNPGPWKRPWDDRRGGYFIVTRSWLNAEPKLEEHVTEAWERVNAA